MPELNIPESARKLRLPPWDGIPKEHKMQIILPDVESFFLNNNTGMVDLKINSNGISVNTTPTNLKAEGISLVCTSTFAPDVTATYRASALGGLVSAGNSLASMFSSFGITSFRTATVNYVGSEVRDFGLEFFVANYTGNPEDDVRVVLSPLYRAVLPTFLNKGKKGGSGLGVSVNGKTVSNVLTEFQKGGYLDSAVGTFGEKVTNFLTTINKGVIGLDAYEAPLGYSPLDLENVKGTVSLFIGDYFYSNLLVISDFSVTYSKELVSIQGKSEVGTPDTANYGTSPLFATGRITFKFIRPMSSYEFRKCFKTTDNRYDVYYREDSTPEFPQGNGYTSLRKS